jgi:hypothetical protein
VRASPLDELVEERASLVRRAGEKLQQVTPFVAIDEYGRVLQVGELAAQRRQPLEELVVVPGRGAEELHAPVPQLAYRRNDLVDPERQMLHSRPAVPGQEGVQLPGVLGRIWRDQRERNGSGGAGDHDGVDGLLPDRDVLGGGAAEPEGSQVKIGVLRQRAALQADRHVIEQPDLPVRAGGRR